MEKPRDDFLDGIKGFLILLVLLGHAIQYGSGAAYLAGGGYWDNWLMKIIYSFHMPLFILISGYFTCGSFRRKGPAAAFWQRLNKLLPPIAAWVPVVLWLHFIREGTAFDFRDVVNVFLTDFWFLWAVLTATGFMMVIVLLPGMFRIPVCLLSLVAAFFLPDYFWAHAYKFMVPYFVLGFVIAEKRKLEAFFQKSWAGYGTVLLWGILLCFYRKESYIYTTGFSVWGKPFGAVWWNQLETDLYRYAVGLAGCGAVLFLGRRLWWRLKQAKGLSRGLTWLGRHSIAIYILSTYMFEGWLVQVTADVKPNLLLWLVLTALLALICSCLTKLLHIHPKIAAIVIGE